MNVVVPCLIVFITLVGMISLIVDIFIGMRKDRIEQLHQDLNISPTYSFTISAYNDDRRKKP